MENFVKSVAYIIASLGGASFLVIALSGFLGKIWATRIMENEKSERDKELEVAKGKINEELMKLTKANDTISKINILQFEKEYEIYSEIWDSLFDVTARTEKLFVGTSSVPADENDRKKFILDTYNEFTKAFNVYAKNIVKYAPFYTNEIYLKLDEIKKLCNTQGNRYQMWELDMFSGGPVVPDRKEPMPIDVRIEVYATNPDMLKELHSQVTDELRQYLIAKKNGVN